MYVSGSCKKRRTHQSISTYRINTLAGFYVLFGVPFYGYVLASAAGFLEERTRLAMKREEIAHGFNSRDRDMLRSLRVFDAGQNGQQARGIAWHQFLSLYLIKLNLACEDDIKAIRQKFEEVGVACTH